MELLIVAVVTKWGIHIFANTVISTAVPKSMLKLFSIMEAVRFGGDLRNLGSELGNPVEICCPDGIVTF